jgi:hypothetical protein
MSRSCHWREPKAAVLNPRVKQYLDKAEECERLAAQAQDPNVKAVFADIARLWRTMARQVELRRLCLRLQERAQAARHALSSQSRPIRVNI